MALIRTRNQVHTALLYDLLHQWREHTHLSKETSRLDGQKLLCIFIIYTLPKIATEPPAETLTCTGYAARSNVAARRKRACRKWG